MNFIITNEEKLINLELVTLIEFNDEDLVIEFRFNGNIVFWNFTDIELYKHRKNELIKRLVK